MINFWKDLAFLGDCHDLKEKAALEAIALKDGLSGSPGLVFHGMILLKMTGELPVHEGFRNGDRLEVRLFFSQNLRKKLDFLRGGRKFGSLKLRWPGEDEVQVAPFFPQHFCKEIFCRNPMYYPNSSFHNQESRLEGAYAISLSFY